MTIFYKLNTVCDICSSKRLFTFRLIDNHTVNFKIGDHTSHTCRTCSSSGTIRITKISEDKFKDLKKYARSFDVRIICDNCNLIDSFSYEIPVSHFQLNFKKGDLVNGKCRNCKFHQCNKVLDSMYLGLNVIEADL